MIIIYKSDSKNRCRYPVSTFEQCSLLEFGTLNFDSLPKATWSVTFGLKPCLYVQSISLLFNYYYNYFQNLFIYTSFFYTYFCLYYFSYLLNYHYYIIIIIFTLTFVIPFLIIIIIFVIHFLNYHYIIIFYTYFCSTISRQRRSTSACHPCVKRTFLNFDLRNVCLL